MIVAARFQYRVLSGTTWRWYVASSNAWSLSLHVHLPLPPDGRTRARYIHRACTLYVLITSHSDPRTPSQVGSILLANHSKFSIFRQNWRTTIETSLRNFPGKFVCKTISIFWHRLVARFHEELFKMIWAPSFSKKSSSYPLCSIMHNDFTI